MCGVTLSCFTPGFSKSCNIFVGTPSCSTPASLKSSHVCAGVISSSSVSSQYRADVVLSGRFQELAETPEEQAIPGLAEYATEDEDREAASSRKARRDVRASRIAQGHRTTEIYDIPDIEVVSLVETNNECRKRGCLEQFSYESVCEKVKETVQRVN